jgi:hypothetical protein
VANLRNHFCCWNATLPSVCTVGLHMSAVNKLINIDSLATETQRCFLYVFVYICYWQRYEKQLGLHVMCLIFVSYFYKFGFPLQIFKSPQYQISLTSIQWQQRWYIRTEKLWDRYGEAAFATIIKYVYILTILVMAICA